MQTFNTKSLIHHVVFLTLILSVLACGGTASTPAPIAPAEDTPLPAEPAATEAAVSSPVGSSPQNPAPRTEVIATADWEFSVVEVHRGIDAADMLKEASAFNGGHPDSTMEYVVVKIHAKYVGTDSDAHHIDGTFFQSMDSAGVLYDRVKNTDVKAPSPSMSSFDDLTAGGEVEGWVVIQVRKDDPAILLVILPRDNGLALGQETIRYISLAE